MRSYACSEVPSMSAEQEAQQKDAGNADEKLPPSGQVCQATIGRNLSRAKPQHPVSGGSQQSSLPFHVFAHVLSANAARFVCPSDGCSSNPCDTICFGFGLRAASAVRSHGHEGAMLQSHWKRLRSSLPMQRSWRLRWQPAQLRSLG